MEVYCFVSIEMLSGTKMEQLEQLYSMLSGVDMVHLPRVGLAAMVGRVPCLWPAHETL
jgi:hypothetical protein